MISFRMLRTAIVLVFGTLVAGCGPSDDGAYVEFLGGGFIFNYWIGEAYYGFVVKTRRRLPEGTVIEAQFEDPSGGRPFILRQTSSFGRGEYSFRSPGLRGVRKGRPYRVVVRLRRSRNGPVIAQYSRTYRSSVSQHMLRKVAPAGEGGG